MNFGRNRKEGGNDPFGERPAVTPAEAARVGYGIFADIDQQRPIETAMNVDKLMLDDRVQVRLGAIDRELVEQLAAVLLGGGRFKDPHEVYRTDNAGPFWLADGWHRTAGHYRAYELYTANPSDYPDVRDAESLKVARVKLFYGDFDAACRAAEVANVKHGKPLTLEEKRGILTRRVLAGDEWGQLSNNALGRELAVAHTTIGRWRLKLLEEYPDNPFVQAMATVIGADGRAYNVKKARKRAAESEHQKLIASANRHIEGLYDTLDKLGYGEYVAQIQAVIDQIVQRMSHEKK